MFWTRQIPKGPWLPKSHTQLPWDTGFLQRGSPQSQEPNVSMIEAGFVDLSYDRKTVLWLEQDSKRKWLSQRMLRD